MSERILIADDHQIVRQGLRRLLESEESFTVIGEAANGRAAVRMVQEDQPDIVVMDVTMPDLNGIDAARQITHEHPDVKVIGLSMHADSRFASEMLRAGASGYLLKEDAFEELSTAIRQVLAGTVYVSPRIAGALLGRGMDPDGGDELTNLAASQAASNRSGDLSALLSPMLHLSPRQREVLQLIAEGRSTKEIAFDLGVSVKTVETHRRQMMDKLNLHSVAQLTKYAVREGLTSVEH
jgi:DNA-binding NarL/FixJ family response regulator